LETSANTLLLSKLQQVVVDPYTHDHAQQNFTTTFTRLGIRPRSADDLAHFLLSTIREAATIEEAEQKVRSQFEQTRTLGSDYTVFEVIRGGLMQRFELIYHQLRPHLGSMKHAIDYGCGAGVLTQMLHDQLEMQIDGVDVRNFRAPGVTVPIRQFDGYRVQAPDRYYQCAVLTNVIHHEAENERILEELNRITRDRLVIIETVPEAENEIEAKADWGRMLLNDVLWNRFFNYANIPCPGTYETPRGWIDRMKKYEWHCTFSLDLGFDQPTIQDRHHLLVFER
jgi:hypothetical protein